MKQLILIVCCISLLSACTEDDRHTSALNSLKPPVVVVSNGDKGGVLLQGAEGRFLLAKYDTYLGGSLKSAIPGTVLGEKHAPIHGYKYPIKQIACRKCGTETIVTGDRCE